MIIGLLVLAVLVWLNTWIVRKIYVEQRPPARPAKGTLRAGIGHAFGAVRFVGALAAIAGAWVALAAVSHGDEWLHNLGVPTFSIVFAAFNPALLLLVGFIKLAE